MSWLRDRHGDHAVSLSREQVYRLLGCFVISVMPQFGNIPLWLLLATAGLVLWRIQQERRESEPPSSVVKLLLGIGFLLGVYVDKGTLTGRDSGTALMVGLIAVKFLELRNRRDYMVLTFVIYFMSVTALLFEQSILVFIYVVICCGCLTVNLITLHSPGPDNTPARSAAQLAFRLIVQGLPLALVLFLFYPRINARYGFNLGSSTSGLPEKIRASSFDSLTEDGSMAFRADFPGGEMPPATSLYWRGFVLWDYNASTNEWQGTSPAQEWRDLTDTPANLVGGKRLLQRITLRAHSQRWLFALDYPAGSAWNGQGELGTGYVLQINRELHRKIQYLVTSLVDSHPLVQSPTMQRASLRIAADLIRPEVRQLAKELRGAGESDEKVVANMLAYYHKNGFEYTTKAENYGDDPLYEFLFVKRRGFCEHFASSFTVVMRLAGVPARVVAGYHGGEYNPYGNFIIVRQLNAHAWSEVFLKGKGWTRVDPTVMATVTHLPAPITPTARQAEPSNRISEALERKWTPDWLPPLAMEGRFRWQLVEEKWDQWVLSYTPELQSDILKDWHLERFSWEFFLLATIFVLFLTIMLVSRSFQRRSTSEEALLAVYADFCAALKNSGVPRYHWEGSTEYSQRAARILPAASKPILRFAREYALLRYGKIAYLEPALGPLREKVEAVREALTQAELHLNQ